MYPNADQLARMSDVSISQAQQVMEELGFVAQAGFALNPEIVVIA